MGFAVLGLSGVAAAQTATRGVHTTASAHAKAAPSGDQGTTVDPLQYNCGNNHPSCGTVGSSYSFYNGSNVELLYSENYYCDANVTAASTSGCEVGAGPSGTPSATSSGGTGTSLGNTSSADILYIPTAIGFTPTSPTQCPPGSATVTCIDHPQDVDLTRLGGSFSTVTSHPIPAHDHVVTTRNNGNPEWWNVKVVPVSNQAALSAIEASGSLTPAQISSAAATNIFLFFQVLPGSVPASIARDAANLNADNFPPATGYGARPASASPNQSEAGTTFNNLKTDCGGGGPNCENVGIAHGYVSGTPGVGNGQDVQLLYSEQYFCGHPTGGRAPAAPSGCEVGAAGAVPPGVGDATVPTAANSAPGAMGGNGQIDPLYIPVPLGFTPKYAQCPSAITCIDHPMTVDLSNIAQYLPGNPTPASVSNVPLPSHDHVIRTRNGDQPEWWNVEVVPVTSQAQLDTIESGKNLSVAQETPFNPSTNGGGAIDTNVYLWFQTLPGGAAATPGPVQTAACMSKLPAGQVVYGAALPDGTGYIETDTRGDVAVFGAATCYGSLTGIALNKPIVGLAVDRTTGGYWLVASDGGVFSFDAPFHGSAGNLKLNRPIVGVATDLNSNGYWLVASDGGVFSYNELFYGSAGNLKLNQPIVGMGLDRATGGYWLVASDGGVFSYGAQFFGSAGNLKLNKPAVGMAPTSDGLGYHLVASDGGVFSYGDAPFYGSTGNLKLNSPVNSGATDNSSDGYDLFASDGGVFTYFTNFYGSAA